MNLILLATDTAPDTLSWPDVAVAALLVGFMMFLIWLMARD